jgi:hypothetical protein
MPRGMVPTDATTSVTTPASVTRDTVFAFALLL